MKYGIRYRCKISVQAYRLQNEIAEELFCYINNFDLVIRHFGIIIVAELDFDDKMIGMKTPARNPVLIYDYPGYDKTMTNMYYCNSQY